MDVGGLRLRISRQLSRQHAEAEVDKEQETQGLHDDKDTIFDEETKKDEDVILLRLWSSRYLIPRPRTAHKTMYLVLNCSREDRGGIQNIETLKQTPMRTEDGHLPGRELEERQEHIMLDS